MKTSIAAKLTLSLLCVTAYLPLSQASANAQDLRVEHLQFCKQTRDKYQNDILDKKSAQSSTYKNSSIEAGGSYGVYGLNYGQSNSSGSSSSSNSRFTQNELNLYKQRDCDALLKMMGEVTIAKIQAETQKYQTDAWRDVGMDANYTNRYISDNDLDATKYVSDNNLAAVKDTNNSNNIGSYVNAGAGLLGTVINAMASSNQRSQPQQPQYQQTQYSQQPQPHQPQYQQPQYSQQPQYPPQPQQLQYQQTQYPQQPQQTQYPPQPHQPQYQQPQYPQQVAYAQQIPDPSVVYILNPMQPIPGHIKNRLFSILGSHNLAPVPCGSQPGLTGATHYKKRRK